MGSWPIRIEPGIRIGIGIGIGIGFRKGAEIGEIGIGIGMGRDIDTGIGIHIATAHNCGNWSRKENGLGPSQGHGTNGLS